MRNCTSYMVLKNARSSNPPTSSYPAAPELGDALTSCGGPSFDHLVGVAHFRKEPNSLGRRDEEASSFLYFQTQLEYLFLQEASLTI